MGKVKKLIGAAGLAAGAAYLSKEKNREKVKETVDKAVYKATSWTSDPYLLHLGKPDEADDSNMVAEGAMTSVLYYYELRDRASDKDRTSEKDRA
ncbi:hypothetical protein [Salinicoccus sp. HZC-1]|uniref:hypothetical protein n=1 Tax=Salinicoccus sp. HZC-1 TaxID=3385497 RepID=UPI00398A99FE